MKTDGLRTALLWLLLCCASVAVMGQVPERPQPARLVNDLAGALVNRDVLEDTLERFAHYTSNQIVVVTMSDLGGYTPQEMAYRIGQQWGVGDKRFNNGVVLLIKPKTNSSSGKVFIATGYGVEGVLTDAVCRRIIENELIPAFRQDNYEGGVWNALGVIMPLLKGEYGTEEYLDSTNEDFTPAEIVVMLLVLGFIIGIFYISIKNELGGASRTTGTWGGPIIFGSGRGGGFGGGGGGYGGGFGGFGGGSFGGGGAGGSW